MTLVCPATGFPKPTITWHKRGIPLKNGGRIKIDGKTLTIENLQVTDTAKYRCQARNSAGRARAITVLKVFGKVY